MLVGAEGVLGTQARDKRHAVPTDRRMPEAAAAAALFAALPRAAGLVRGLGAPGAQLRILASERILVPVCLVRIAWPELPSRPARRCACAHWLTAANKLPRKHVEGRGCCCDPRLRSEAPPRVPYRRWRERASSYPGGALLAPNILGAHGSDERAVCLGILGVRPEPRRRLLQTS